MRILTRYILREYLVPLFYCLTGFVSIYVLFELFGSFARLSKAKLPFLTTVDYFAAYLAPFFEWIAPAALMLAALYTMWSFCRHSELIAMRASGVSFLAISAPILGVAALMAAVVWGVNNEYVPARAQWARLMKTEEFDLAKIAAADNLVYRNTAEGRTWTVTKMEDGDPSRLLDVKIVFDRPGGGARLATVTAERADFLDGEWWLTGAETIHYDTKGAECVSPTPELDAVRFRPLADVDEEPADFAMQNRDWAYNSVAERLRFLRTRKNLSPELRRKYVYDTWAKILSPFACIIITLFSIPAGVATGRQSVFAGILGALGMFFGFATLTILSMVGADTGWLPPVFAAFLPHVVFLALGVRAFLKQR